MILATLVVTSTALMGCDEGGFTTVDERGGWVVSDDGRVSLDVPPDALEGPVELAIEISDAPHPGAKAQTYTLQPQGMPLLVPAMINFELDGDEGEVDLVMRGRDDWTPVADRHIQTGGDAKAIAVEGSVLYFTDVTVVARPSAPPRSGATR